MKIPPLYLLVSKKVHVVHEGHLMMAMDYDRTIITDIAKPVDIYINGALLYPNTKRDI